MTARLEAVKAEWAARLEIEITTLRSEADHRLVAELTKARAEADREWAARLDHETSLLKSESDKRLASGMLEARAEADQEWAAQASARYRRPSDRCRAAARGGSPQSAIRGRAGLDRETASRPPRRFVRTPIDSSRRKCRGRDRRSSSSGPRSSNRKPRRCARMPRSGSRRTCRRRDPKSSSTGPRSLTRKPRRCARTPKQRLAAELRNGAIRGRAAVGREAGSGDGKASRGCRAGMERQASVRGLSGARGSGATGGRRN